MTLKLLVKRLIQYILYFQQISEVKRLWEICFELIVNSSIFFNFKTIYVHAFSIKLLLFFQNLFLFIIPLLFPMRVSLCLFRHIIYFYLRLLLFLFFIGFFALQLLFLTFFRILFLIFSEIMIKLLNL